ncbi:hypothetical protein D3C86_1713740 [compost metagenome]
MSFFVSPRNFKVESNCFNVACAAPAISPFAAWPETYTTPAPGKTATWDWRGGAADKVETPMASTAKSASEGMISPVTRLTAGLFPALKLLVIYFLSSGINLLSATQMLSLTARSGSEPPIFRARPTLSKTCFS